MAGRAPDEFDHTLVAFEPGDVLCERYKLLRILGRGGMGIVYLAADTRLDHREVAVKLLPAVLARNARAIAKLKKEAATCLDLTHPNIVRLHNFEVDPQHGDAAFLVMQYVQGQTLDDLLAEALEGLPPPRVGGWALQIAEALDYAHAQGVLHRDIKPSNIIIDTQDRACLMDFGIAREARDTMTRVTGQDSSGTLPYMSPQQLLGENHKANDIYSFAATLYEALTGSPPFTTGDIPEQIRHKPVMPIKAAPPHVNAVLLAALAKDGAARPRSAKELAQRLVAPTPIPQAPPPPPPPRRQAPPPPPPPRPQARPMPQPAPAARPTPPRPKKLKKRSPIKTFLVRGVLLLFCAAVALAVGLTFVEQDFVDIPWAMYDTDPVEPDPWEEAWEDPWAQPEDAKGAEDETEVVGDESWVLIDDDGKITSDPNLPEEAIDNSSLWENNPFDIPPEVLDETIDVIELGADEGTMPGAMYVNSVGMEFVYIPPGTYTMGSPRYEDERDDDEQPHEVTITRGFYMLTTEVTQAHWAAVKGWRTDPSQFSGEEMPVDSVTWFDAVSFCEMLTLMEGVRYRLPTEAEWEYACRAGTTTPFSTGYTLSTNQANYDGDFPYGKSEGGPSLESTTPAGFYSVSRRLEYLLEQRGMAEQDLQEAREAEKYGKNEFDPAEIEAFIREVDSEIARLERARAINSWGLADMHGNLMEWCSDWYGEDYYRNSPSEDPTGPRNGRLRVARGGSWNDGAAHLRSAERSSFAPGYQVASMGFRVVFVPDEQ